MTSTVIAPMSVRCQQATEITALGRSTLLARTYSGEIPSYLVGVARYWRVADLRAWVDAQGKN